MNRYVCIHGHFYQPPRENPWLDEIETQKSADPFHDWNERVTFECYAPNANSPIMDIHSKIVDVSNNYSLMSFNFGPSLLSWMERKKPELYKIILDSDKESQKHFSGHGSAIAQGYNHIIMPLANCRDKKTQIIWGIKDFEFRFQRKPEGMWLPETAVDIKTLEHLAQEGIIFTILSPHQAKKIRHMGENDWIDVSGGRIDPKRSYLCCLPSGKKISIFFYDGPLSQRIAFGDFLSNGEKFAQELTRYFQNDDATPQLIHVATDGETFGHHHRLGDMALAYCFQSIQSKQLAKITNYGEFLEISPPTYEVKIIEKTSWSCSHGIERWRDDCGCGGESRKDWNQKWRKPLRQGIDEIRAELAAIYEREMLNFVRDPWLIRDRYIDVILNRSQETQNEFIDKNTYKEFSGVEKIKIIKLLEMQRFSMLMYTSCGWFFDEISRIESIQVMQYAARAMQLAHEVSGILLENDFLKNIKRASSNISKFKNGAYIYKKFIQPKMIYSFQSDSRYATNNLWKIVASVHLAFYVLRGKVKRLIKKVNNTIGVVWNLYIRYHLNNELKKVLLEDNIDLEQLEHILQDVHQKGVKVNVGDLTFIAEQGIVRLMYKLFRVPKDVVLLKRVYEFLRILDHFGFSLNLHMAQSVYFAIWKKYFQPINEQSQRGHAVAEQWIERFNKLDEYLHVH